MDIQGLHHITMVSGDAQRTVDFYTGLLGLRMIKQTVNFDAPDSYHLYFGDRTGRPGTAITFFEWPSAPKGHIGIGGTHHVALRVPTYAGLLGWNERLRARGLEVYGPYDRGIFQSLYFRDPDGHRLELTAPNPEGGVEAAAGEASEEDLCLWGGMHHISVLASDLDATHAFWGDLLGLPLVRKTYNRDNREQDHWFWAAGPEDQHGYLTYFGEDARSTKHARLGRGQTHHFALAVPDADTQLAFRERLLSAGLSVSPVMERVYFKSIYTQDPDGHIVELATAGPGFTADETVEELGSRLVLPPWLEQHRARITAGLKPLVVPEPELEGCPQPA